MENEELDDGLLERSEPVIADKSVTTYEPVEKKKRQYRTTKVAIVEPVEEVKGEPVIEPVAKVKKPRTEAQIKAFEKAKAVRDANSIEGFN
jgi:hypothetical protein